LGGGTDEDWTDETQNGYRTKSRKSRSVPLTGKAIANLPPSRGMEESVFGYKNFDEPFVCAARRAGLLRVSPHALRHTFASRCIEAGVDIVTLQQWLGHASITQTQVYTHVSKTHERAAIDRFERHNSQQVSQHTRDPHESTTGP
jgi:integrase